MPKSNFEHFMASEVTPPLVSLYKALLNPYFWGGKYVREVGWPVSNIWIQGIQFDFSEFLDAWDSFQSFFRKISGKIPQPRGCS